jgi:hypothetical protein
MRLFIALVVIVYLICVVVGLSPTVSTRWASSTASDLFSSIWLELPHALGWPGTTYHRMMGDVELVKTTVG